MATLRSVLNRAFNVLGEPAIDDAATALTTDYQRKVLEFLNQFKEEIEAEYPWRSLRQSVPVTVLAGTGVAEVPGTNERTRLVRDGQQQDGYTYPLSFDVTDPASPAQLTEMSLTQLTRYKMAAPAISSSAPSSIALGANANGITVYIWPVTDTDVDLQLELVIPQEAFDVDDLDTAILIPSRPLLQGTTWFALTDRGEELGQNSLFTEERYRLAVDDAVSAENGEGGELELVPV